MVAEIASRTVVTKRDGYQFCLTVYYVYCRPDADLVDHMEDLPENAFGLELDDVGLNRNLDEILKNEAWASDAAYD